MNPRPRGSGVDQRYAVPVPEADNLTLTVSDDGSAVIADGQIDSHTSQALAEALGAAEAGAALSLDLAAVTFIDSSGLRAIVRAHKRQSAAGGSLTIVRPSDIVTRLLDITGLTGELQVSAG